MASAQIGGVWIDHNISPGGVNGMVIHVMFSVQALMGRQGQVSVYFNYLQGEPLRAFDPAYSSGDGRVCVWSPFAPDLEEQAFPDVQLFISYASLGLVIAPGAVYNLVCQAVI
jgi:hypothetical protein